MPAEAECTHKLGQNESLSYGGIATIRLDGKPQWKTYLSARASETTETIEGSTWLFEPGKATGHTLTAEVTDECGVGGGNSGGHFKIGSISIDVLGAR